MKYFTHYWTNETWNRAVTSYADELVEHTAGNLFFERGVHIGDAIYIVTNFQGELFLCCKIIVAKICKVGEAAKELGMQSDELWDAEWHVIAAEPQSPHWHISVPLPLTQELQFTDGEKSKHLKFEPNGGLDKQTLRGVRQLTPDSAAKLDEFLNTLEGSEPFSPWLGDATDDTDFVSGVEGNKKQRFVTYYERLPQNRADALKIHGYDCKGCGFNFENIYGSWGKDFIHVHHVNPVSQFEKPKKINAATDLTVLCPNCHAMVRRKKNKTLTLAELQSLIQRATRKPKG